jgi:site-specific DNA recombinase
LVRQLAAENVRNRYSKLIDNGAFYKMLKNRTYIGMAVHKGNAYPGGHKPIIEQALWDKVRSILKESPRKRGGRTAFNRPPC